MTDKLEDNMIKITEYNEHDWNEFWREIKVRDKFRNESFAKTFPEYYNLIKDYINVE